MATSIGWVAWFYGFVLPTPYKKPNNGPFYYFYVEMLVAPHLSWALWFASCHLEKEEKRSLVFYYIFFGWNNIN